MKYIIEFDYRFILIFFLIYIFIICLMKYKFKLNLLNIIAFTILYSYFIFLVKETQFDIHINNPGMEKELGSIQLVRDINLIPFKDFFNITSLLNVIMFIPIGFLQGFVSKSNWIKTFIIGLSLSSFLEVAQLLVRTYVGFNFRIVDINDLICNTCGALIGFEILIIFLRLAKGVIANEKIVDYLTLIDPQ